MDKVEGQGAWWIQTGTDDCPCTAYATQRGSVRHAQGPSTPPVLQTKAVSLAGYSSYEERRMEGQTWVRGGELLAMICRIAAAEQLTVLALDVGVDVERREDQEH